MKTSSVAFACSMWEQHNTSLPLTIIIMVMITLKSLSLYWKRLAAALDMIFGTMVFEYRPWAVRIVISNSFGTSKFIIHSLRYTSVHHSLTETHEKELNDMYVVELVWCNREKDILREHRQWHSNIKTDHIEKAKRRTRRKMMTQTNENGKESKHRRMTTEWMSE